jgi:leucyl-tRNA synthetase
MEYNFREIEKKWQQKWKDDKAYEVPNESPKPKFYVLDMFPYPSGAGLHVGHPLGYIASDIYSRYKRLKGFNVLHPMGFDSFGLPAEQYALETGQHPAVTTEKNIETFKAQLDKIGFCYDWSREVRTSDPSYYKWTQKIFLELFNSYFCNTCKKALPLTELIKKYETKGNSHFTAEQWHAFTKTEQEAILMKRRLAFSSFGEVNWCEALGTVLANDEVVNGVSERGGHPVIKKKMRQWYLRITAYADRLLQGLETVQFSEPMKEMQRNWIGRSEGAEIVFSLKPAPSPQGEKGDVETETQIGKEIESETDKKGAALVPKYSVSSPMHYELAKRNRKDFTDAEDALWQAVRGSQLGAKIRRQHPIDAYIVDFVSLQDALIIEADGGYHENEEQKLYDENRTRILNEIGFTVIRFRNDEILKNIENVKQKIKAELKSSPKNVQTPTHKEEAQGSEFRHPSTRSGEGTGVRESSEFSPPSPPRGEGQGLRSDTGVRCYTTRPDTIFGVDFLVLAPEHSLVTQITTEAEKEKVEEYLTYVKSRSDRERMSEVKQITGCFTGAYATNPFNGKQIPVWIAEYVLAGYGTGAIMAVPCGDQRDFAFAQHFNIPITNIIGNDFNGTEANATKEATLQNSDFLNGMLMKDAIGVAINKIEELGIGKRKVNYRMRDAGFSRQRYWGEPFPIVWQDETAIALSETDLPLELPHAEKYGPGPEGEGPLANMGEWVKTPNGRRETSTMPGYAGSSWYFLRYMDPHNTQTFCDRKASDYWNQVDVYVGGTEHAVGHLLYSRMWTKVLYDLGYIGFEEPFKKLVNQGMIQGSSRFVYRLLKSKKYISKNLLIQVLDKNDNSEFIESIREENRYTLEDNLFSTDLIGEVVVTPKHVDVNIVDGFELDISKFKKWKPEFENAEFILEESGKYICGSDVEKMSKSKYNTVNPDELCNQYGADTFRMYEMFLGPVEQSKPWDTKGIEGVHRFLKKLWRLFFADISASPSLPQSSGMERGRGEVKWVDETPTDAEYKILHKTIKKIEQDTENFSYNTAVAAFMIAVNELADAKCYKKEILSQILILLTPYAPHIAEELWAALGCEGSILDADYPTLNETYLVEATKEYPVSINGKTRSSINLPTEATEEEAKAAVLSNEIILKWMEGAEVKKFIFVKGRMINVVI